MVIGVIAMTSFILGILIGANLVGSSVQRTISVSEGELGKTFGSALLNSLSYFLSINFIIKNDIEAYIGTVVGSTAIVMYMAYKNREKRGNS